MAFEDSRLSPVNRDRKDVVGPHGRRVYRAYCVMCSKQGPLVSKGTAAFIYVCNRCVREHGTPAGLMEVPEEFWRTGKDPTL